MKSTTYISNILALGLGTVGIISVSAQDDLEDERSSVCGFTLQANGAEVVRTNDWKLSNSNYGGRLTRAQFYITDANNGRLYGGGGDRCGFDPYLTCDDEADDDADRQPFIITSNSSLTFFNQSFFYLCNNTSFTITDPDDDDDDDRNNPDDLASYPYIYPPIGTTNNTPRNYKNCTGVVLVASECQENSSDAFTMSPSAALQTPNPTGTGSATGTGTVTATSAAGNAASTNGATERVGLNGMLVGAGVAVAAMEFAWM